MRLLNRSYFGESIFLRLSRLELHEFGAVCTSNDLAGRMDTLSACAVSNATKTKVNELASFQSPATALEVYRNHVNATFQTGTVARKEDQPYTVVDQIEYLESAAFGKTRPNVSLQKRVNALEQKYCGRSKVDDKTLTYRVAQLLYLLNNHGVLSTIEHG